MLTSFTLLAFASGAFRIVANWLLRRRYGIAIELPGAVAAIVVALAALPDFLKPVPFPLPLGVTVGLLLPDLLVRRA